MIWCERLNFIGGSLSHLYFSFVSIRMDCRAHRKNTSAAIRPNQERNICDTQTSLTYGIWRSNCSASNTDTEHFCVFFLPTVFSMDIAFQMIFRIFRLLCLEYCLCECIEVNALRSPTIPRRRKHKSI